MSRVRKSIPEEELMEMYGNMSIQSIANRYGVCDLTILKRISELLQICNDTGKQWYDKGIRIIPIKEQHIDTSYIKGTLQSEYLAMRERNKA